MATKAPLVMIAGGGVGGRAAARRLKRSPVDVLLIDLSNRHVFQPLLYDVRSGKPIQSIYADGVVIGEEHIQAKTVVWAAGVAPSLARKWLGCAVDRAGRVLTQLSQVVLPIKGACYVNRESNLHR